MRNKAGNKRNKIATLIDVIEEIRMILEKSGLRFEVFNQKAPELLDKLQNRQLVISVLGQFKRGKSSLINAFLGKEILPVSVLPLTSVPVFISYGKIKSLKFISGGNNITADSETGIRKALLDFATEEGNPVNRKKVKDIKLYYPADFLKDSILIVDTPGIGSVFSHNTKAAEEVIPKSDIGIFVVSPDPPFTEIEQNYFKSVLPNISTAFFVINKMDTVSGKDLKKVKYFYSSILAKITGGLGAGRIFCVSSKHSAFGKNHGVRELKKAVLSYLAVKKDAILINTTSSRLKGLIDLVKSEIEVVLNTLKMPVEKFEKNIQLFTEKLAEIETASENMPDTLVLRQNRITRQLDDSLESAKIEALSKFLGLFSSSVKNGTIDETSVGNTINKISDYFEDKYKVLSDEIEDKALDILNELKTAFEEPLKQIKKAAADFFHVNIKIPEEAVKFEFERSPYWIDRSSEMTYKTIKDNLFIKILPGALKQHVLSIKLKSDFENIVLRDAGNIRWALIQNMQNTFIKYEEYYNDKFEEMKKAIINAVESVKQTKTEIESSGKEKMSKVQHLFKNISSISERIG